jgi:hypothetical protein
MLRIEVVCADRDQLGEGPLWDVAESRLYWIDSYGPAIHVMDAQGGRKRSWRVPEPIGSMATTSISPMSRRWRGRWAANIIASVKRVACSPSMGSACAVCRSRASPAE